MKRRNAIKVLGGIIGSAFFLPGELTGIAKSLEPSFELIAEKDYWNGAYVTIVEGIGMGQTRRIESSVDDKVTIGCKWDMEPDSSSRLKIVRGPGPHSIKQLNWWNNG